MIAALRYWLSIFLILVGVYLIWVNDYPVEVELPWPVSQSISSSTAVMYFAFLGLGFLIGVITFGIPLARKSWTIRSLKKKLQAFEQESPPEIQPMSLGDEADIEERPSL